MRYKKLLLFAITALLFITVWSQNKDAKITGIVKDAQTKQPITDAVITVSSSSFKGQKFAVTDTKGRYQINNLTAGIYHISFEMEGYEKFARDSVNIKEGMSLGVNSELTKEQKQARNGK